MNKKQKEEQEKLELLNQIANRKTEFNNDEIQMIKRFIFNIITSKTVMTRYEFTRFGNFIENKTIGLYDCIEYLSNLISKENVNE